MFTRVRELREQKKISQLTLSVRVGCSQNTISKIEAGTADPRAELLIELANYFEVSVDYLLGLSDYKYHMESAVRYTKLSELSRRYAEKLEQMNEEKRQVICSLMDYMMEEK